MASSVISTVQVGALKRVIDTQQNVPVVNLVTMGTAVTYHVRIPDVSIVDKITELALSVNLANMGPFAMKLVETACPLLTKMFIVPCQMVTALSAPVCLDTMGEPANMSAELTVMRPQAECGNAILTLASAMMVVSLGITIFIVINSVAQLAKTLTV